MDLHGKQAKGWHGVDFDGTLAKYTEWKGPTHTGSPVPKMLARVKQWIADGEEVRIFTARVNPKDKDCEKSRKAIQDWTMKHLERKLKVTHEKDKEMIDMWDDRAVQIVPNKGTRSDGKKESGL